MCSHGGLILVDHSHRPFYAAGVDTYNIIATELVPNRVMWGLATQEGLMMFNEKLACAVRVDGGKVGHFECTQLEANRVKRHVYTTSWHDSIACYLRFWL